MNNKYKEFAENTAIIFLGKFSAQFISFCLLPLYTYYLASADYGYVDLIQSYVSLCVPILTLRFDSAAFRFLIDARKDNDQKKEVFTNTMFVLLIQVILFFFAFMILSNWIKINYKYYILLNIIFLMYSNVLLQVIRGLGKNKEYSIASFITALITLIVNIVLIIGFGVNAKSILISSIIANLICSIYLLFKGSLFSLIDKNSIDINVIIEMSKYSIPMIPNSLSWWVVNVSDRSIITFVLGSTFNGIYSVSCKFSNILNTLFNIINLSWQESASLYIDSDDVDIVFSRIINEIINLFCCIILLMLSGIAISFNILIGSEYLAAYNYIPILLIANIFNVFIGLYGGIYVAKRMTKEVAKTTMLSAVINIIINVLFIKYLGLYAASMSTLIAYLVIAIYRHFDVQKYVKIKLDKKKIFGLFILIFISSGVYLTKNFVMNFCFLIIETFITLIINKNYIEKLLARFKK